MKAEKLPLRIVSTGALPQHRTRMLDDMIENHALASGATWTKAI